VKKRTRIVPSLVMTATFAAVIPSCGGTTDAQDGGKDGSSDVLKGVADVGFGVAAVAYCCFDAMGVADAAFGDAPSDTGIDDAPEGG
jgi:hypothetical protein